MRKIGLLFCTALLACVAVTASASADVVSPGMVATAQAPPDLLPVALTDGSMLPVYAADSLPTAPLTMTYKNPAFADVARVQHTKLDARALAGRGSTAQPCLRVGWRASTDPAGKLRISSA